MHVEVKGAIMATDARVKSEQETGEKTLIEALGEERARNLIANRVKRDGDKAHITLAGPQDGKKAVDFVAREKGVSKGEAQKIIATLPLDGNWEAKGLGSASSGSKVAYFVVIDWPGGGDFRASLGLSPDGQDFHITVGFGDDGDVHGVPKNRVLSVGELAKTATLRSKVIRLAYQNPDLRSHLLPLLVDGGRRATEGILWLFGYDERGKNIYTTEVVMDEFVHFAPKALIPAILASGRLRSNPPGVKKFGGPGAYAVSIKWGKYVPGTQHTHIKGEIGAIRFKTNTVPQIGFAEEVVWPRGAKLQGATEISFSEAVSLIRSAPQQIDGFYDYVLYNR